MELIVKEEFKNLIPPPTEEERAELEKSLLMFGCRDKIITWRGIVIDGHNRLELCTKNGIQFETLSMDYEFEDEEEVKQWIIKNQFGRRNISSYQRAELALQLKESIAKKARENQLSSLKQNCIPKELERENDTALEEPTKRDDTVSPNLAERKEENAYQKTGDTVKSIDTREEIAKIAGVSHGTIQKVEVIVHEAPQVIKDAAKNKDISINKAYNITKEVKDLEDEEEKQSKAEELLNQQYDAKSKEIDKQKKIADKIADALFGILTTTIDEERIGYYLEYSPKESLDKHISRCDEAIEKFQQVKEIFENMRKIKVVK